MKHQLTGKVVSDKMAKTVVVSVDRLKEHPKYHKRYRVTKRYKAHDEKGEYKTGDVVIIEECRPMSAGKCWMVIKRIEAGKAVLEEGEPKPAE
jgi:small subunit ribosomal protein S17